MKRRIAALILFGAMMMSMAACSNQEGENITQQGSNETEQVQNTPEPETPSNAATVGDYDVEIKSAVLTDDYEGNPAIIVTYAWTNNSEETTSAMTSVSCSAFQDGVGLETAIIMDDSVFDSDSSMTEVRPGTTIDVQSAFVLSNTTSVVEVEVGEWLTIENDPPVAYMEFDPATL